MPNLGPNRSDTSDCGLLKGLGDWGFGRKASTEAFHKNFLDYHVSQKLHILFLQCIFQIKLYFNNCQNT